MPFLSFWSSAIDILVHYILDIRDWNSYFGLRDLADWSMKTHQVAYKKEWKIGIMVEGLNRSTIEITSHFPLLLPIFGHRLGPPGRPSRHHISLYYTTSGPSAPYVRGCDTFHDPTCRWYKIVQQIQLKIAVIYMEEPHRRDIN